MGRRIHPRPTLAKAIAVVQDYPRHSTIYKPEIVAARILARHGDDFKVYLRIVKAKFLVSAVLNANMSCRLARIVVFSGA